MASDKKLTKMEQANAKLSQARNRLSAALKTANVAVPLGVGGGLGALTGYLASPEGGARSPLLLGAGYIATGAAVGAFSKSEAGARTGEAMLSCGAFILGNEGYKMGSSLL